MIDERSRRRDGEFDEQHSAPVVLADGQAWYLPKPWVALHPIVRDGKVVDTWRCLTYGEDLDAMVGLIARLEEPAQQIAATASLGIFLLLRNYELSDEELESLFVYEAGQERSREMVRTIIATATGTGAPKRSAAGGD